MIHPQTRQAFQATLAQFEQILSEGGPASERQRRSAAARARLHYSRLSRCCTDLIIYEQRSTGEIIIKPARCYDRFCPICQVARCTNLRDKLTRLINARQADGARLLFLTLTLRNGHDTPGNYLRRLLVAFRKLRRSKLWSASVTGGLWTFEVTVDQHGRWHPHLHALLESSYIAQKQLVQRWRALTGDSFVIDIRPADLGAAKYVSKYMSKVVNPESWSTTQFVNWFSSMEGRRTCAAFGNWYNLKLEGASEGEGVEADLIELGRASTLLSDAATSSADADGLRDTVRRWTATHFPDFDVPASSSGCQRPPPDT